jgi:tRNA (guanine-N7-)-methyltransferase
MTTLLPALRLDLSSPAPGRVEDLFPVPVREVWLEIGFGGGEHLAEQARRNPDIGFIGAEPFVNGVAKLISALDASPLHNIRVIGDDVRPLFGWLPAGSLARVFILFPDPWPKRRHESRRIISPATLAGLARAMHPGASLRLATDVAPYASWAKPVILESGLFSLTGESRIRPQNWVETRYESKAIRAGRPCQYLEFRHKAGEASAPGG